MKSDAILIASHQDNNDDSKWLISLASVSSFQLIDTVSSEQEAYDWLASLKRFVIDKDDNQMQSYVTGFVYSCDLEVPD